MIAKSCPEYSLDKPSTLVAISGSGNVSQYTALKVIELGATVKSLSDSKGALIATEGYTKDDVLSIGQLKLKGGTLEAWAAEQSESRFTYYPGTRPSSLFPLIFNPDLCFRRQTPLDTPLRSPSRPPRSNAKRSFRRGGRGSCEGWRTDRCRRIQHGSSISLSSPTPICLCIVS